jgi:hypothetical protein
MPFCVPTGCVLGATGDQEMIVGPSGV